MSNFVFFGSPEFARTILGKLIRANVKPSALVANPDRPVGRKQVITPPPTKMIAEKHGIPVFQPETLSDIEGALSELHPDLFVVAAYAKIIPGSILKIPRLGAVGVHPSLLPKYRGSSPIQSALLDGVSETGVTLYFLDTGMDHGPIVATRTCAVDPRETYETLHDKLANIGGELLVETLPKLFEGKMKAHPQNENGVSRTRKFEGKDGFVDEKELEEAQETGGAKAAKIDRMVRALNPEPGVWTLQQTESGPQRMKLLAADVVDGKLKLTMTQMEGKKPVTSH